MPGGAGRSQEADIVIALPGNELFAKQLAIQGGYDVLRLDTRRFPDGESYLRILGDVEGRRAHIVCTLAQPDLQFLPLAFLADAARDLGAREVNLIAPYLGYMRQDRRFNPGEAITSRSFARLISGLFDGLITVDAHLHRYDALEEIYSIPAQNLHAAPVIAAWVAANVHDPLLVGPDEESAQWVRGIAEIADVPFTVLSKTRYGDRKVRIDVPDLSAWKDQQPILIDDIASSGRTMIEAARQISSQGLKSPICAIVHGLFADDAFAVLSEVAARVVSTDSVPHESNAISLVGLVVDSLTKKA